MKKKKKVYNFTYMFVSDVTDIAHVHDTSLVSNHAHSDGVFAHLGGHVLVYLDTQVLQHQQS